MYLSVYDWWDGTSFARPSTQNYHPSHYVLTFNNLQSYDTFNKQSILHTLWKLPWCVVTLKLASNIDIWSALRFPTRFPMPFVLLCFFFLLLFKFHSNQCYRSFNFPFFSLSLLFLSFLTRYSDRRLLIGNKPRFDRLLWYPKSF